MCYSALIKKHMKQFGLSRFDQEFLDAWNAHEQIDETKVNPFSNKPFKSHSADGRFFPQYITQIAFMENGKLSVGKAVYSVWLPEGMDPYKYTSYNVRKDNITSRFWAECFGVHHGFIVLSGFSEWVEVKDLLRANLVTLNEVVARFDAMISTRKERVLASGKKYSLTKVEKSDPHFRKIIIDFELPDEEPIFVPVIFNIRNGIRGFAMVTDDPLPEVEEAGHDRTPIMLTPEAINEWVRPEGKSVSDLLSILERRANLHFRHKISTAQVS